MSPPFPAAGAGAGLRASAGSHMLLLVSILEVSLLPQKFMEKATLQRLTVGIMAAAEFHLVFPHR
jgi:hypothetical protein